MTAILDTETAAIRVLVVDDHTILRQGLVRLLESQEGIAVCGEAANGRDAVECAQALDPQVVLMDLAMPELNGLDSTRRILKARPRARVLALTNYVDDDYVSRAIEAGVSGYVLKDADPEELFAAVRTVARGERHFSRGISAEVVERAGKEGKRRPRKSRAADLTHREREVMKLLAEGNTVKTVATILGLSQKTVDTHKTNLMKKLDIHNRVELVKYAINEKLIQL